MSQFYFIDIITFSNVTITTKSNAANKHQLESIASIKFNAPRDYTTR